MFGIENVLYNSNETEQKYWDEQIENVSLRGCWLYSAHTIKEEETASAINLSVDIPHKQLNLQTDL